MTIETAREILRLNVEHLSKRAIGRAVGLSHFSIIAFLKDPDGYPIQAWRCPDCGQLADAVECHLCRARKFASGR